MADLSATLNRIWLTLLLIGACSGGSDPPPGEQTVALPLDQTYSFGAGELRRFDFAAENGAEYTVVWEAEPDASGAVHLYDPGGDHIVGGELPDDEEAFTAVAGTYRLEINATDATQLHLRIFKSHDAPGDPTGELRVTLPADVGDLEIAAGTSRKLVFAGAPGLVVLVDAGELPETDLAVYPRDGDDLFSPRLFPVAGSVVLISAVAVEEETDYIVEITNHHADGAETAHVRITPVADVQDLPLQGAATAASGSGPGTNVAFTFGADAGDVVNYGAEGKCAGFAGGTVSGGLAYSGGLEGFYETIGASGTQALVVVDTSAAACPTPPAFYVWAHRLAPGSLGVFDFGTLEEMARAGTYLDFATDTVISGKNASADTPCFGYLRRPGTTTAQMIQGPLTVSGDNMLAPISVPAGRSTVEMVRYGAGTCSGKLYLRAVADPLELGSIGAANPALAAVTTTVDVGEHKFYALTVTDSLAIRQLKVTAVTAGWANVVMRPAVAGQPFHFATNPIVAVTNPYEGGINMPRASASFTLAPGTYYIETYGNIYAGAANDVASTFTWDIE